MKKYTKSSVSLKAVQGDIDNVIVDGVGDLSTHLSRNEDKVVEQFYENGLWYRVYESGWCEQGGWNLVFASTVTVTFLKEMRDVTYFASGNYYGSTSNYYSQCYNFTTTSMTLKSYNSSRVNWQVKGFIAK
jgi:hypothetical protein